MHIYFSGIGGVGIGPLAEIAAKAGHAVSGSDRAASPMTAQLQQHGIELFIGQTGAEIAAVQAKQPLDWLVISSAIPANHPEVVFAKNHGIRVSKRDELLNKIIAEASQKLVAISGTHGKTTVTAMLVWLFKQFNKPVSYSIGTRLSFAPSGDFDPNADYLVYEADEYDRNMLHFKPYLSLINSLDYDHPDIYPTPGDYDAAFREFARQSQSVIMWQRDAKRLKLSNVHTIDDQESIIANIKIAGQYNRQNAWLAVSAFCQLFPAISQNQAIVKITTFPGTGRRFERFAENIYTDYAHHPKEIRATLQLAQELNPKVIAVYQPHQNSRQHEMIDDYQDCFAGAQHVYWLPTYLSRGNPALPVLKPEQLIKKLRDPSIAEPAEMNDELVKKLRHHRAEGALIVVMGAGDVDNWLRQSFS